jgi:hypothetical protein
MPSGLNQRKKAGYFLLFGQIGDRISARSEKYGPREMQSYPQKTKDSNQTLCNFVSA